MALPLYPPLPPGGSLHLLRERPALGSKKSRPDQPFNVVQVRLAADPGGLKRFKKPSNPEKLPKSTYASGARGVSSSWPPPGPTPKSFTYPEPKKGKGSRAVPSGPRGRMVTQSATILEQRLEQMAVGGCFHYAFPDSAFHSSRHHWISGILLVASGLMQMFPHTAQVTL